MDRLIQIKQNLKRKKPRFIRQEAHKKKRLSKVWRRPKGLQSKMRLEKKGYRRVLKVGFRSPKKLRDHALNGKKILIVNNIKDLDNGKDKALIIAKNIGLKKKLEIIELASKQGLVIMNIKDVEKFIKDKKTSLADKKEKTTKKIENRIKKKEKKKEKKTIDEKVKEKKIEKKAETEGKSVEEVKKEQEKKDIDKVLTKKDNL